MGWWWTACFVAGCSFGGVLRDPDAAGPDASSASDAASARVTAGLIGLWQLDENGGGSVSDTSGIIPSVVLAISDLGGVSWSPGALTVNAKVDINNGFGTNRLIAPCRASDQVTLEAWITSSSTMQTGTTPGQPARVVSVTVMNIGGHSISIGQLGGSWAGQVRTTAAGLDNHGGSPMLLNGNVPPTGPVHLVLTSTITERRLYVDGVPVMDDKGGLLDRWEPNRTLAFAGDPGLRNSWSGTIHLVAMFDRALSETEVMTNFLASAGP